MKLDLERIKWVVSVTVCTNLKLNHLLHSTGFRLRLLGSPGAHLLRLRLLPSAQHLRCILTPRNSLAGRLRAPTVVHRRSLADIPARLRHHTQLRLPIRLRIRRIRQGRLLPRLIIPHRNLPDIRLRPLLLPRVLPKLQDRLGP